MAEIDTPQPMDVATDCLLYDKEKRQTTEKPLEVSPLAGKPADPASLVNIPELVTAYYADTPDPSIPAQRVAFGTSGHRGSAFEKSFNQWHILAISQAICLYRKQQNIDGPLFLGMDTHALSIPALASALEVLAANDVEVMIAERDEYTPTPAISLAILTHNKGRKVSTQTESSSRPPIIRPMTAASNTTHRTVARRKALLPLGSKPRQTSFWRAGSRV